MIIRATNTRDWARLRSIRLQALAEAPTVFGLSHAEAVNYDRERWEALASPRQAPYFWLAIDRELPVGMVGGNVDSERRFNLVGLWVNNEMRGHGVAQRLVELVKARALELGFQSVFLGVSPDNLRAANFYKRQGFAYVDEVEWLASHPDVKVQGMRWISPSGSG